MLNCNLTNEEEQCIDNILSNGLAEIKDLTLLESHSSGRNTNSVNNQLNVGDLKKKYSNDSNNKISEIEFKTKKSNQPKSMALRALINQLKENVDYGFKSDEEITEDNQITMENINCPKREPLTVCSNPTKKKEINLNIDNMEKNSRTFLEMKDEMMAIQNKIENINSKISKSVNPTYRNNFHVGKTERLNKKKNEFIKKKSGKIKKDQIKNNIYSKKFNTSISSLNNSFSNSNIKTKYSTVSNFKNKYDELKEKYDLQKEKIAAEEALVKSIQIKIKQITKKNNNYNKLVECNKKLFSQEELLKKQILESENIRKEQSKLIRSLQREIDMFRGDNEMNSYSNMAEIYQQMKESLLKTHDSQV